MSELIDLRFWKRPDLLRAKFAQRGFGVIDLHARIASNLCGGTFAPEEFLAESDAIAIAVFERWCDESLPLSHVPRESARQWAYRKMNFKDGERCSKLWGPIEDQKVRELDLLPPSEFDIVCRKKDMVAYLKEQAGTHGFVPSKEKLITGTNAMFRPIRGTSYRLQFSLDINPKDDNRPGRRPVPPSFWIEFAIDGHPESARAIFLENIVAGSLFYQGIQSRHELYSPDTEILSVPVEHWSNIIKLDIHATLTLLGLWVSELEEAASGIVE